jgi:hypothetical protein
MKGTMEVEGKETLLGNDDPGQRWAYDTISRDGFVTFLPTVLHVITTGADSLLGLLE